jgi:hypothetical protein
MATSFLRSLSRAFAPFLRLFMTDPKPDDLPDLFPRAQSVSPIQDWAHRIQNLGDKAACCFVESAEYCKCTEDSLHEFLIVCIRHQPTGHKTYLAVNRSPRSSLDVPRSSSEELVHTVKMISSSPVPAFDTVTVSHDGTVECITPPKGTFDVIAAMTFAQPEPPTVIFFATLAEVVSAHQPSYQLIEHQCYWFAFSIWQVMAEHATRVEERKKWDLRGKCSLSNRTLGDGRSLEAIKNDLRRALHQVEEDERRRERKRRAKEEQVSLSSQLSLFASDGTYLK